MDSSSLANFSELRQKLNNWDIDAEDLLLRKVKAFTDRYLSQYTELSKNYSNFAKHIESTEIEHMKSMNLLKTLSLNRFVEHVVDESEAQPVKQPEQVQPQQPIDIKSIIDLSVKAIPINNNRQNEPDQSDASSSQIGFDNNKNTKLPFIIGTKDFMTDRTAGVAKMANNIPQDLDGDNPMVEGTGEVIEGFIPGKKKEPAPSNPVQQNNAPSSVPSVPSVPVAPSGGPSVPVPPPMNAPIPKAPVQNPVPVQNPPSAPSNGAVFAPVPMQPNTGGKGVPLPPPLMIPPPKAPNLSAPAGGAAANPQPPKPVKKFEPKPKVKSFQELLKEQAEKMRKKKAPEEEKNGEPANQISSGIKLPNTHFEDEDDGEDDPTLMVTRASISRKGKGLKIGKDEPKVEEKPKEKEKEEEKIPKKSLGIFDMNKEDEVIKPIQKEKEEKKLANAKKKMMNLFGDDDEENEDEMDIKKRTETVTLKMSKITNVLPKENKPVAKPPEPKPQVNPPVKKEEEKPNPVEQKSNGPLQRPSTVSSKFANMQNMLAGRMGPGGMRPSEVRKTESSASSEVSVQVQKEDYQKLMEKKAPVVAKKKPKKKGFGGAPATSSSTQSKPSAPSKPVSKPNPVQSKPSQPKPVQSKPNDQPKPVVSQPKQPANPFGHAVKKSNISLFTEDEEEKSAPSKPKDSIIVEDNKKEKTTAGKQRLAFLYDDDD